MNKFPMAAAAAGALLVSVSPAAAQQFGRSGYATGYGSNYSNRAGYADNGYARRSNEWDQNQNYRSYRRHHQNRHSDRDNRFERHDRRDRDRDDQ